MSSTDRDQDDDGDAELWARSLAGDEDAFAVVFDRHVDRVYRHARRFAMNAADAEDVTALVFLEAWRARRRVRVVDDSVIAWLLVTATNISRNTTRSRIRHEKAMSRVRVEPVHDHAETVLERLSIEGMREPMRVAFDGLSRSDQEVLALCVIEQLPPREVATMMRLPSGTIRTRLNRAKQRLRLAVESAHPRALESWMEAR
ncbi:RNA polymerase sigma factor [Microbacterium sp. A94]|uniref:RNA polymerase sigma factor n=1 Tax=Microbacterium sp. A94 TaxID=3450717 RepID=UPI003F43C43D